MYIDRSKTYLKILRRRWGRQRKELVLNGREIVTSELLEIGKESDDIEHAYSIILDYLSTLNLHQMMSELIFTNIM
mgnify:CR=1 FL=1